MHSIVQESQLRAAWDQFFANYLEGEVQNAYLEGATSLAVDFEELQLADPDVANALLDTPETVLVYAEQALFAIDAPVEIKQRMKVRPFNLPRSSRRNGVTLGARDFGRLIQFPGIVKLRDYKRANAVEAAFECKACGNIEHVIQEDEDLVQPHECLGCERQGPWRMLESESKLVDFQRLEVEEAGTLDHDTRRRDQIRVHLREDLADGLEVGDSIIINGILRAQAKRRGNVKQTTFDRLIDAVSVEVDPESRKNLEITAEEEQAILELAADENLMARMVNSFAPDIDGMTDEKEALLLAIIGGTGRIDTNTGRRTRGDIHVLLVGDPSTAKSDLLQYSYQLAPRGIMVHAKTTTAAGLAGAVEKLEGTNIWTVQAGALSMADQGTCSIDEIEKLNKDAQNTLLNAIEQQVIHINKGGVHQDLTSRCSVLAAANPRGQRFDQFEPVAEQFTLEPALLSRFDLRFAIMDRPEKDRDLRIARAVLGRGRMQEPPMTLDLLRKYIHYARTRCRPVLDDDANETLATYYADIRIGADGAIPITTRQLDGLRRITEAYARLHLRDQATQEDARRAMALFERSMKSIGTDRETGAFDVDIIETGRSHSQHDRIRLIRHIIKDLTEENDRGFAREEDVLAKAQDQGIDETAAKKALETMRRNNEVFQRAGAGTYALL